MPRFYKRQFPIEAWQLTAEHFDGPHPNPLHIRGLVYNQSLRNAVVANRSTGTMTAEIGDWIIRDEAGTGSDVLTCCDHNTFEALFDICTCPECCWVHGVDGGGNEAP